jgi:N6-adenosine-specific RNA methylase IME4
VSIVVLTADPPWKFGDKLPGASRGAEKNYACMSTADICAMPLPVSRDEPDVVLFLWCVESMQRDALDVVRAWGFTEKTSLIWEKLTTGGKAHFGMGRILRAAHERCIVAQRGKCPPAARNVRSRFSAPVGQHSAKPDAFYKLVELLYPDAVKHEMFARTRRDGWLQSGFELPEAE